MTNKGGSSKSGRMNLISNKFAVLLLVLLFLPAVTFASQPVEPAYCNPSEFIKYEIRTPMANVVTRLATFKLGRVVFAGMGVGASRVEDVSRLAQSVNRNLDINQGFCTWFINDENPAAERTFNHTYVRNPAKMGPTEAARNFSEVLGSSFTNRTPSFVSCAERYGYLGIGCFGQKHRGPSAFGMILAFSGCSPESASAIVNRLWGLNDVRYEVRHAIIQEGARLGVLYPEYRAKLQSLFLAKPWR